jgi:oligopeptide/dipeptide ABC transporter ATP-binding protein
VGLEADQVVDLFPHQLSMGMAQRACIAMAILPSPYLLIADEPTSAVDASVRRTLIDLVTSIQRSTGMSLILITHDLDVARTYGDRIAVMFAGRIVESASRKTFFEKQHHPYSQLLVDAQPQRNRVIPTSGSAPYFTTGTIPDSGCRFHLQCPIAKERCKEAEPELEQTSNEREVRCFYWK